MLKSISSTVACWKIFKQSWTSAKDMECVLSILAQGWQNVTVWVDQGVMT